MGGRKIYIITADAVAGRGVVFEQGTVVEEDQLWGMADLLVTNDAIRLVSDGEFASADPLKMTLL